MAIPERSAISKEALGQNDDTPHSDDTEKAEKRPLDTNVASSDTERAAEPSDASLPRQIKGLPWIVLVVAVFSAQFLFALDNTIVADVQPRIIKNLGEITKLPWITVGFELGAVCANLLWGTLYGLFSNKNLFISSIILFEVGSAICGAAPTMDALIAGRTICGLGGNGIYIGTINIVSALTTIHERPLYLSFAGVTWGIGTLLGPVIGGAFADSSAGWRWSFYINICVGGALTPVYLFLLPAHKTSSNMTVWSRICQIDIAGVILFWGSSASGIMAVSFGGGLFAWNSGSTIGLFCCSGVLWILFGIQQVRAILTTEHRRLFPVHLLRSYEMWVLFAQTSASISALFITVYFIPLYFQFVYADSALQAGIRILPLIVVGVFFSVLSGGVMSKFGYYMPWYFCGSALVIIGAALIRTVGVDSPARLIYGYSVILGAGVGCFVQASFPVAQAKVPEEDIPAAVAFIGCAQLAGLTLSFAIAYSIFLNTATTRIKDILPEAPQAGVQAAITGVGAQMFRSLSDDVRAMVLQAVSDSISDVYNQVLATGAFSLLLSIIMKRERLFLQS